MKKYASQLISYSLVMLISITSLVSAFYMQYYMGLYPCNLCMAQRFAHYSILAFTFLSLGAFLMSWRKISFLMHFLAFMANLGGLALALKHYFLQHLADKEALSCSAIDLGSMFNSMPIGKFVQKLFEGTADCAKIDWTLWGLSIADYSLIIFLVILILQLKMLIQKI